MALLSFMMIFVLSCSTAVSPEPGDAETASDTSRKNVAPVPRPEVNPQHELFQPPVKPLSPQESREQFFLPRGYAIEAVLTEPEIKEPVAIEFDANGRMYVAEMRTYMQNIDGKNQREPESRVSVHVDTDNDGRYDEHTTFADGLKLPRMMLALREGELLISETWDDRVFLYRDTDGDFQADEKTLYFKGTKKRGNLEHQSSGLIWAIDNWLYTTFDRFRVRWDGSRKGSRARSRGQWGLTQDNYGKPWPVNAGGEVGPLHFQQSITYGSFSFQNETDRDWPTVYPLVAIPDVQGGKPRVRANNTLNHFTATCGPAIVRAHRLPDQLNGDLLFADPVGRLIRRGRVENEDGVTYLNNPYENAEFIRSTDPIFRPVNVANAPDGTVYIVDMYRGIIQEGFWLRPGSYLRGVVREYEFQKIVGRGRIWRLGHQNFPSEQAQQPRMYEQSSSDLLKHLAHPNGWWRDMAQRQIILRQDTSVAGRLREMVSSHGNHLARIHALWTLEGLNRLTHGVVRAALKDSHPYVRKSAIRASESLFRVDGASESLRSRIVKQFKRDDHPQVRIQVMLTANLLDWKQLENLLKQISGGEEKANLSKGVRKIAKELR